jgi:hypothetical protein
MAKTPADGSIQRPMFSGKKGFRMAQTKKAPAAT